MAAYKGRLVRTGSKLYSAGKRLTSVFHRFKRLHSSKATGPASIGDSLGTRVALRSNKRFYLAETFDSIVESSFSFRHDAILFVCFFHVHWLVSNNHRCSSEEE